MVEVLVIIKNLQDHQRNIGDREKCPDCFRFPQKLLHHQTIPRSFSNIIQHAEEQEESSRISALPSETSSSRSSSWVQAKYYRRTFLFLLKRARLPKRPALFVVFQGPA